MALQQTIFLGFLLLFYSAIPHAQAACGYAACPATKPNMVNVHLSPHSHDDVGWLKTVDQYYYGHQNNIQHAGVQYILDSVVQALLKDETRRFIQVESAFFFKWYEEQSAELQQQVQMLVAEGRLEFAGGAWSMNDEAAVHYQSIIDQFSFGLKHLANTFGDCGRPRIGWQIDPFGHSREMASMFAQMGYDGEFFARIDWLEKSARLLNSTAELIWHASADLGEQTELFTGLLYNHYSAPPGFCFDNLCSDAPIIDGDSYDNNVKQRVDDFLTYIRKLGLYYRSSNHLLVPMGDDFQYENANMNFKNMDKLIKYVNERQKEGSRVNVFYSTPSCYLNALHNAHLTWPNKTEDFFPYSTDWHTYWTGYYSSRPTQKRYERDGNHFLQVTKQLTVLANLTGKHVDENLDELRKVMGIMQHHDAITGTEKQRVAYDYDRLMASALDRAQLNARSALQRLTNLTNGEFESCLLLNISVCAFTQDGIGNDGLVVTLFNPLSRMTWQYVRIPLPHDTAYEVTDSDGRPVVSQLVPLPEEVIALEFRESSQTTYELVFEAFVEKISNYYIRKKSLLPEEDTYVIPKRFQREVKTYMWQSQKVDVEERADGGDIIVQNELIKLSFSNDTGHLVAVQMNGVTEKIAQNFYYYRGALGNNAEFKNRSSGAYIFRPNGTEELVGEKVQLTIYEAPLVKEVHQRFNHWISQVIRIYSGVNRVEFEWLVGPIPIEDGFGKEIITRFTSGIANDKVFWTDSNGREMLRRVRNEREYFVANLTEGVSGNYYPITARIVLQDNNRRMALLNDRAQGGSSIRDGELELMLHRRLLRDDAFGVGEALNETAFGKGLVARGKVHLILNSVRQKPSIYERLEQQELLLPFWPFFSRESKSTEVAVPKVPDFNSALPLTVHILTLEPYSTDERIIRFENYMDGTESSIVTFNIRGIFDQLGGVEIRETTLDGNMLLSEMRRMKFHQHGQEIGNEPMYQQSKHVPINATKYDEDKKFDVLLEPMQIRTFVIRWT